LNTFGAFGRVETSNDMFSVEVLVLPEVIA